MVTPSHTIFGSASIKPIGTAAPGAKGISTSTPPRIAQRVPGLLTALPVPGAGGHAFGVATAKGGDIMQLNAQQPLMLGANTGLAATERALLIGFDPASGLYLPAGVDNRRGDLAVIGSAEQPQGDGKSIPGMLLMAAYKLSEPLGIVENPYPLLRSATVDDAGRVHYDEDGITALKARVAKAGRILLLIHGFTGDSEGMLPVSNLLPDLDVPDYDLLLAFDYDNLNTRIQDSATKLAAKLEEIGLAAGHGKTLHLVAHSLGTQITRWYVEQAGGNRVLSKVVLLGAPNAGTPLAALQDWLTHLIGLGLNALVPLTAAVPLVTYGAIALSKLVAGFEKIDVTLDQLQPKSEFYSVLNAGQDPGLPYHIIIGDTKQIKFVPSAPGNNPVKNLFASVFNLNTRNRLLSLAFGNQPNDIAISVKSAEAALGVSPSSSVTVVACDHLQYFSAGSPGLVQLAAALA